MQQATAAKEPALLNKQGDPSPLWIAWYAEQKGVTTPAARQVLISKILHMDEPPLKLENGKRNELWVLWYRLKRNVSRNISLRIWAAKTAGEYIPQKRMNMNIDRHLRVIAGTTREAVKEEERPFVKVGETRHYVDKRLGRGELEPGRLCRSALGRRVLLSIMNKDPAAEVLFGSVVSKALEEALRGEQ